MIGNFIKYSLTFVLILLNICVNAHDENFAHEELCLIVGIRKIHVYTVIMRDQMNISPFEVNN